MPASTWQNAGRDIIFEYLRRGHNFKDLGEVLRTIFLPLQQRCGVRQRPGERRVCALAGGAGQIFGALAAAGKAARVPVLPFARRPECEAQKVRHLLALQKPLLLHFLALSRGSAASVKTTPAALTACNYPEGKPPTASIAARSKACDGSAKRHTTKYHVDLLMRNGTKSLP